MDTKPILAALNAEVRKWTAARDAFALALGDGPTVTMQASAETPTTSDAHARRSAAQRARWAAQKRTQRAKG